MKLKIFILLLISVVFNSQSFASSNKDDKKFDNKGTLRQEIIWQNDESQLDSIPQGVLNSYYPDGKLAATFSINIDAPSIFFDNKGNVIKTIYSNNLLDFSNYEDFKNCQNKIHLDVLDMVKLYEDEGDISYNYCRQPYQETHVIEIVNSDDNNNTKISFDKTGMIRKITPYINGQIDGMVQKYDSQGNLSATVSYVNGNKEGIATGYYANQKVAFIKEYNNNKIVGNLVCYSIDGNIMAIFKYENGLKHGVAQINTGTPITLMYERGSIVENPNVDKKRNIIIVHKISDEDANIPCLAIGAKVVEIENNINLILNKPNKSFNPNIPLFCQDENNYALEEDKIICTDTEEQISVSYIPSDNNYKNKVIYNLDLTKLAEISFLGDIQQGFTKTFDDLNNVIEEAYYDNGELITAYRYFTNGRTKNIYNRIDDDNYSYFTYNENGKLLEKQVIENGNIIKLSQYDIAQNKFNEISFKDNKIEAVREFNAINPSNYIEYNLLSGEYYIVKDGQLLKGGKLCGYEIVDEDINIIYSSNDGVDIATSPKNIPIVDTKTSSKAPEFIQDSDDDLDFEDNLDNKTAPLLNTDEINNPVVEKVDNQEVDSIEEKNIDENIKLEPETNKLYYANGNIRQSVKSLGDKLLEVRDYSKSGLLVTDTMYYDDNIIIEKYYGTGQIRRKVNKVNINNPIISFISREDYYDNGALRYELVSTPETLLFTEKTYDFEGNIKTSTKQKSIFGFVTDYYNTGIVSKQIEQLGDSVIEKEVDAVGNVTSFMLNNQKMPVDFANNSKKIIEDSSKIYAENGSLSSVYLSNNNNDIMRQFYDDGQVMTEIVFFHNGEISIKSFDKEGKIIKSAKLNVEGDLVINMPTPKTIKDYRKRYWYDYNNPNWIENKDKYSIKQIARLNLDLSAYILAELDMQAPLILQKFYSVYK